MTNEIGLVAFEARMYDPLVGRWISMDPARQFASGYVGMGNNPVSGIDPDGEYSKLGASVRNFFQGGMGIYKAGDEWGFNTIKDGAIVYMAGKFDRL